MNVVITGGGGFVGRWLVAELQREEPGFQLAVWDRVTGVFGSPVMEHVVDITNATTYRPLLEASQPTWLIHLAAVASVQEGWKDPRAVTRVNTEATRELLKTLAEVNPNTRVLAVSSADIYGVVKSNSPLSELPLNDVHPNNPYGESKFAMEKIIEESFADRVVRVRPFPHIGPGQRPGFVLADFASQVAAIEVGKQEPVIKVGNLSAKRDFTDVRDVVRAYRLLLEKGQVGETYHVASGTAISIDELLQRLLALSTVKIVVEEDPAKLRPVEVPILVGDASKLKNLTGWTPQIPLDQTLRDTLTYWREQTKK